MTEMLKFALGPRSLVPDGSALVCGPGQSSLGDCYYFTLGLLDVSGFWNASRLFWANASAWPGRAEAPRLCKSLSAEMARLRFRSGMDGSAAQILHPYCPTADDRWQ